MLSASRDGKLLIWNALPTKNQLKLHDGFIILLDYLPKHTYKSLGTEMGGNKSAKLLLYFFLTNCFEILNKTSYISVC